MIRDEPPLIFWLTRLRAECEELELWAQVKSFCAFVDSCPYVSHTECSKCFLYYLRTESIDKVFAR